MRILTNPLISTLMMLLIPTIIISLSVNTPSNAKQHSGMDIHSNHQTIDAKHPAKKMCCLHNNGSKDATSNALSPREESIEHAKRKAATKLELYLLTAEQSDTNVDYTQQYLFFKNGIRFHDFAEDQLSPTTKESFQKSTFNFVMRPVRRALTVVNGFGGILVDLAGKPNLHNVLFNSMIPSVSPSSSPSESPSFSPSRLPSSRPSVSPSLRPSVSPSTYPTVYPSNLPSYLPTYQPTSEPSASPSFVPSNTPSESPTLYPTVHHSENPSDFPSNPPTLSPIVVRSKTLYVTVTAIPDLLYTGQPKRVFEEEVLLFISSYFDTFYPYSYMDIRSFTLLSQEVLPTPPQRRLSNSTLVAIDVVDSQLRSRNLNERHVSLLLAANITAGSRLKSDALLTSVSLDALNSDDLTVNVREADVYFGNVSVRAYEEKPDISELLPAQVLAKIEETKSRARKNPKNFPLMAIVLVAACVAVASVVAFVIHITRQGRRDKFDGIGSSC